MENNETKRLLEQLQRARKLLMQAYPYIKAHYDRSRYGFGVEAKKLYEQIDAFLDYEQRNKNDPE